MKDNKFTTEDSSIPNPQSPITNPQRGFTLIEIAMVLVVIGILLSLGVGMIGSLSKRAKYNETKDIVRSAREAIYGYAVKNGFLPASDISLTGARALDPWGRPLEYKAATGLSGSGNACGLATTDITITECTNEDCTASNTKSNIAFIVYSTGEDADGACTGTISPFKIWEQGAGYNSPCTYTATNPAHQYDDIVQYVTLDEIRYTIGCPQTLALISPAALTEGEEDSFYSYSLQAIGGKPPYTWSVWGPTNGLSLNVSGLISGTINKNTATNTGELTACTDSIAVSSSVTDSAGSAAVAYSGAVPVRPRPLTIVTQNLPTGTENTAYTATLSGAGGKSSYSWNVTSGALPPGLSLAGGVISGTISNDANTVGEQYNFTIRLDDGCGQVYKAYSVTVNDDDSTVVPTCTLSASPSVIHAGQSSTLYWAITNGPASGAFSPTSGSCSSFASSTTGSCATGAIAATTTFNLPVTTANGTASCAATVTVVPSTTTLPPTCTLTASPTTTNSGQTATLYWAITNGPADGTFSPSGGSCTSFTSSNSGSCTTGALSSSTTFNLPVTNSNGTSSCSASVTVTGSGTTLAPTCTLTASPSLINAGQTSTLYWAITNGPADGTFSPISGACSSFTNSNSGSCTTAALSTITTFNLPVSNSNGTANCAATVTVTPACATFTGWSSSLPAATNCSAYSGSTTVIGGVSPFSWALGAGALPSGLSFCTGNTAAACTISGTPLASPASYSFTPQATDSCANPSPQTTSSPFSITVSDACYAGGMQVRNNSGATRYWLNGAVCTSWTTGNDIAGNILPAGSEVIYSNNTCTTQYCATPITYCQQKPYDTAGDNDCRTQMTGACVYADR